MMKREFLKGLGLEQAAIDAIMAEYGSDVEGYKEQITDLTKERDTANESLKAFEGVDVEELQNRAETIKNQYESQIRDMKINGAIEKALTGAKAKHTDLLIDKFDREKIEIDKDGNIKGIDDQLKTFKESYKDLFSSEVVGKHPANPEGGNGEVFNFDFTSVRGNGNNE